MYLHFQCNFHLHIFIVYKLKILVKPNKVEQIKYFSTLLRLIFIEITRGPFMKK